MNKAYVFTGLLSLGVCLGLVLTSLAPEPARTHTIEWLDNPRELPPFQLESAEGEFTNRSLEGRWTILSFGFINCPDVCPTSLSELSALANLTDVIFVSVDPKRDSVDELDRYVRNFDTTYQGVTGTEQELRRLADALGIQFKVTGEDEDSAVAHSVTFSIVDPEGLFRGRFRPGFDPVVASHEFGRLGEREI